MNKNKTTIDTFKELITLIESEINEANKFKNFLNEKHDKLYKSNFEVLKSFIPTTYKLDEVISKLENILKIYKKCLEENIDLCKKYYLNDDIYLSFYPTDNGLQPHFYVNDKDGFLYDNVFGSHSGINEWICDFICEKYNTYTGNSKYTYAFNTIFLEDIFKSIENAKDVVQTVNYIKSLIDYFDREHNQDIVVKSILLDFDNTINNMKNCFKE